MLYHLITYLTRFGCDICQISALTGDNVDELLETVMLVAEVYRFMQCLLAILLSDVFDFAFSFGISRCKN